MASKQDILDEARGKLYRLREGPDPVPEGYLKNLPRGPKYQYSTGEENPPLPTGPAAVLPQAIEARAPAIRPELQAEMAAAAKGPVPQPSLEQAVAATREQPNMSTPPDTSPLAQALREKYPNPIQFGPLGPGNETSAGPGTTYNEDGTEATTDPVDVEHEVTVREDMIHAMDMWNELNPTDYSKMEAVEGQRQKDARSDAQAGMLLKTLGGTRLQDQGAQVFQKALASKPLRPNAADLGYFGPDGKFAPNEDTAKLMRNKQFMSMIKADDKREAEMADLIEARAKRLEAAGKASEAAELRRQAERGRNTRAKLRREQRDALGILDRDARKENAQIAAGRISTKEQQDQVDLAEEKFIIDSLAESFNDSYSGGGPFGKLDTWINQQLGSLGSEESQQDAEWWSRFQMLNELPTRHKLFGAALTPTEKQSWARAQRLNPGSDPAIVRRALQEMQAAAARIQKEYNDSMIARGKNVDPIVQTGDDEQIYKGKKYTKDADGKWYEE